LGRIELRCEISANESIVVEPQEDTALDISIVDDSDSPSPARRLDSAEEAMEIDSRPSLSQHSGPLHQGQQHERHQFHQPLPKMEPNRQSLPTPSAIRSPTTLAPLHSIPTKAPSNPLPSVSPAVRPHDLPYGTQPSSREQSIGSVGRRDFPPNAAQIRSPSEPRNANGSVYPRSLGEVSLDAIERLQTQTSQNSGALAAHTRDIRRGEESFALLEATLRRDFATQVQSQTADIQRVDEAVARLHLEMQSMRQALETVSHELAINRAEMQRGAHGQAVAVPDAAIELMAQQVAVMSHKTSELDNLRVTVEIMKKKIHYLEQGAKPVKPASALQTNPHAFQPPQSSGSPRIHATPQAAPKTASPMQTPSNLPTYQSFGQASSSTMADTSNRPDPTPSQSTGWASVNAGTKRTHMSSVESPREGAAHVPGSPKRQRIAASDPHVSNTPSQSRPTQPSFERRDTEGSDSRLHAPTPTLPSQHSISESILASQTPQSSYVPYTTQDGPSDDSWRPESQRLIEHRPRGRGRGGGPGSRGGRGRKSLPAQIHRPGTPEWERDDWQGVSELQAGPDSYYNHVARSGRGIARRGSGGGGGGRGGYTQSERAVSLGSQGVSPGFRMGSPNDPYAHTKKTRTKPIRNADGVLIRKDGRPDMRSQSSAANLRKVHARKEGDQSTQGSPTGFTPTNLHHAASVDGPDSPSPSGDHQAAPSSVQRKHNAIMGKMFPSGLEESRRQNDYAHQVFEDDRDHTAHPRNQHHHQAAKAIKSAMKIKKEQSEQVEDSPNDGDVDMDRVEEHEQPETEQHTPDEHFHDASSGEQPELQATQEMQEPMVPETQAVEAESSSTLTASTHTLT
jgi:hypothetical protein